ncbi:alpha/beta hydrolase [Roseomonas sp. AR75]|jgi:pimeloyl-ACP methyl ester carboxylesterase|uniref:alpha/beta hydrolase n=1 Tax=Roseomonas sp. AR75 TaxID=2562311 RepID=UPI0010C08E8B|nr:alpha/beta hydrolase [Roseomonas sp. AR75]
MIPAEALSPHGTRRVALGQGALFLRADGAGPTLLCIPGAYHGAWCYEAWLDAFAAAGIASAALEKRGHGTLRGRLDPMTGIDDFAADAAEAAAALGAPPVLVGHSLGALIAMRAAQRLMPGGVSGLVLVAPSPPGNLPGAAKVPLVPEGALRPPPDLATTAERFLGGDTPEWLPEYQRKLSPESPRAMNERYDLRLPVDPAHLAGLPVFVLEAGRDDAARHPPGQDAAIAAFLGGTHALLPDAPHCFMLGDWAAESAAAVIAWYRAAVASG